MGLIDNWAVVIQVLAWCQTGSKPFAEAVMTWFTDACIDHQASMS